MTCYTKEELELYRSGRMSVTGKLACAMHLFHCRQCADLFQSLSADDEFLDQFRDSIRTFRKVRSAHKTA